MAPGTFDDLSKMAELSQVYAWAYGYLVTALDAWNHGRMHPGQLATEFEELQREVAAACERVLAAHGNRDLVDDAVDQMTWDLAATAADALRGQPRKRVVLDHGPDSPVIKP